MLRKYRLMGVVLAMMMVASGGCSSDEAPETVLQASEETRPPAAYPPPSDNSEASPPAPSEPEVELAGRSELLRSEREGEELYALVFGNGAYRRGDALVAPAKDATLMAGALRSRGYHVLLSLDRDFAGMQQDVQAFDEMSQGATVRVLYFAGHGFEFDNANYLLPVDMPASVAELSRVDVRMNALRLDTLTRELGQGAETLIAIIDACRVLPSRGAASGLTLGVEEVPKGTIVAYATSPGQVAMDSLRAYGVQQDHSPYTYYLADALISQENDTWDQALNSTYSIVNVQTRGEQKPWMNAQVTSFPTIGQDMRQQPRGEAGGLDSMDWNVSSHRSAAGAFWARESDAAARLERDGNKTDADLLELARGGDSRAAVALSSRWWDTPDRQPELIAILEPAALRGHAMAQTDLGSHLYRSRAKDSRGRTASYWWQLASAQGVGEARSKLAMSDPSSPASAREIGQGLIEMFQASQPDLQSASDNPTQEDN